MNFARLKQIVFIFLFSLISPFCFGQEYKINNVEYLINGKTKTVHLEKKIKIDTNQIFSNQKNLEDYINNLVQKFRNLRIFDEVQIECRIDSEKNTEPVQVSLIIKVTESKNFIIVPYYKYDSNDGHTVKGKIQDSNFLGTLKQAAGDFYFSLDSSDSDTPDIKFGAGFEYDYPFYFGLIEASWNNLWDFSYTVGKEIPEWNVNTGFTFKLPLESISFVLDLNQKFVNDFDYKIYNDELYFGEVVDFSTPIILQTLKNIGDIVYSPGINFTYYWTNHKLNIKNDDLLSPELLFYHKISGGNVDWIGNFRNGIIFDLKQSAGYNYNLSDMVIGVEGTIQFFKSWKYAGINSRLYGYSYLNKNKKIGNRIRGIRDDEYYSTTGFTDINGTSSPSAIVLNLDFPIHILTFNFEKSPNRLLKNFGLELQASPFIDFALTHNRVTNRTFDFRDCFLCGGVEFIVFPEKFKSLQIRASAGLDLTRILFSHQIDDTWRPNVSPYEVSFGIGLHY